MNQSSPQPGNWLQVSLLTAALCLALLALFYPTAVSMVDIWWRSETFAHGFFILPITLYLIWRLRDELRLLTPQPTLWGLPLLAMLGFGWLLAEFATVTVVQQLAFVAMLPVAVYSMLGWQVTRRILFPLCFLVLAVPMGEGLIPPLMEFTADFTVMMLQLTGIPVFREGLFFEIPSGRWSVVEGCSGVRYLIASVTLGCLYAYLTYTSYLRRSIFILAAFVVPILANGLRAYMIVMIANYSDYKLAMGVDHFIYGWVWFGIVITLMFWVGGFWAEDPPETVEPASADGDAVLAKSSPTMVAVAVLVVALVWPVWGMVSDNAVNSAPVTLTAPTHERWQKTDSMTDWRPRYLGTDAELMQSYERDGVRVSLYLGYYREQRQNAELVNSQNVLIQQKHEVWSQVGRSEMQFQVNDQNIDVWQGRLRANHGQNLQVVYWHWLGGQYSINPYLSKLIEAKAKLLGQPRDGAVILLATEFDDDTDSALASLQQFAEDMLPLVQQQLDAVAAD
ncbi:MAG TPA: exosortase A [Candidatus Tenderia electrophaga]|uniref:Exosortase A n=1 Tax=Candidatus Tenderia electrophaga TaxID=1748243 RepID=A0A832J740_9GAMM|nr:exosortase A [Candidatus Tenderia electrophaga]